MSDMVDIETRNIFEYLLKHGHIPLDIKELMKAFGSKGNETRYRNTLKEHVKQGVLEEREENGRKAYYPTRKYQPIVSHVPIRDALLENKEFREGFLKSAEFRKAVQMTLTIVRKVPKKNPGSHASDSDILTAFEEIMQYNHNLRAEFKRMARKYR